MSYAQRLGSGGCAPSCIVGGTISVSISTGDGHTLVIPTTVTSVNTAQDFFLSVGTASFNYATAGTYTAFYNNSARTAAIKNFNQGSIRMETLVTPYGGVTPAVISMPALITIPLQASTTFQLNATSPTGATLRYRMATTMEGYDVTTPSCGQQLPPGMTINSTTGLVTWDTTQILAAGCGYAAPASGDQWTAQFIVEVLDSGGNVIDKTPIDVIIELIISSEVPPTIVFSNPGPITVVAGTQTSFTATGDDISVSSVVTLNTAGVPVGATVSNTNQALTPPVTSTFTWTPTLSQSGTSYVISFTATNDTFQQALGSVTIHVISILPPVLSCQASLSADAHSSFSLPITVSDPQSDAVTVVWSADSSPIHTDNIAATSATTNLSFSQTFLTTGPHTISVLATDTDNKTATCSTAITVSPAITASTAVSTTTLTAGRAATTFTPVTGSGGTGALVYTVSPALPSGLTLNSSTGAISGTATAASASATYTVTVTDTIPNSVTAPFTLLVNPAVAATTAVASKALTATTAATFTPVTATGGTPALSYTVAPALPAGLSINTTTGAITGTPTTATASAIYTVTVTDTNGATSTANFTLVVNSAVAASTAVASTVLTASYPAPVFTPVTTTGGTGALTFTILPSLPTGLSLNSTTGTISGTPTIPSATTIYTVTATDTNSNVATAQFTLKVNPAVTTSTAVASKALTATVASSFTPITASGGTGTITYSVYPTLPAGLTFNPATGAITGTPANASANTTYTITATDSNGATSNASFSLVVNPVVSATTAVASTVLTATHATAAFSPVTATGGTPALTYTVSPGLPAGLTLNTTTGAITGTPTSASATTTYTVTVTDANSYATTAQFALKVNSAVATTIAIASKALTATTPTSFTPITATGGTGAITYSVSPALPAGLTLNPTTGAITGTPTSASASGTYTITATDSNGATSTATFTLVVNAAVSATTAVSSSVLTASKSTTFTPVTATGGTGALTYAIAPTLPTGLTLNATTGAITGTPTGASPTTTYTVTATDTNSNSATAQFALKVSTAVTTSASVSSKALTATTATSFTPITATGGTGTITYAISPALPAGLNLNPITGAITGTPTGASASGTYTVTATDSNGATSSSTFTLVVNAAVAAISAVSSKTLTANSAAAAFAPITATGGTGTLTYAITPALPTGLIFNTSTGTITGTPIITIAASNFTVTATDQNATTSSATFSLIVLAPTLTLTPATISAGQVAVPLSQTLTTTGGIAPYTYAISAGSLPSGLTLSASGVLTGTPTAGLTTTFTILSTDSSLGSGPYTASTTYTFTINPGVSNFAFAAATATATYTYGQGPVTLAASSVSPAAIIYSVVSGPATINPTTGLLTLVGAGPVVVKAIQAANANYATSSAQATLSVVRQATVISVTASSTSITPIQPITFTATVSPKFFGAPTGSVTFYDNGTAISAAIPLSSGSAQLHLNSLLSGSHIITVAYSGDTNFLAAATSASTTTPITIAVAALTFTLNLSGHTSASIAPGSSASFPMQVNPTYVLYPGTVTFVVTGLPTGATYTVSPATLAANSGPQQVIVTINVPTALGSVQQQAPQFHAAKPVALFVALLLPLFAFRRFRKSTRALRLTLLLLAATLATSTFTGCGAGTGFFNSPVKNYVVTFSATSGSITQSTTINLQVQ
jgi:hypothetical protein